MADETLYQYAAAQMRLIIDQMIALSESTGNFHMPTKAHWADNDLAAILLCGKGCVIDAIPASVGDRENAWLARSALAFGIERAATGLLYQRLDPFINQLVADAYLQTDQFKQVSADWIYQHPRFLPVLMHAMGTFSKRDLQKEIGTGTASDSAISKPVSKKLAALFARLDHGSVAGEARIRERMKATTEGIVRDLVGRLLLEEFVAQALRKESVPFLRESEYPGIVGVVYDFRADFVVPGFESPKAFIEVRKSSAGHASLYAKDKMFSAINWKGRHRDCLGIMIVEGPWTQSTLEVMGRVFDYVIPIERSYEAAKKIKAWLDGDKSVLRWLIQFEINPASSQLLAQHDSDA